MIRASLESGGGEVDAESFVAVVVAVDGVEPSGGWTLEPLGIVRFAAPPAAGAAVSAGFRFDVKVRFAEDRLEISRETFRAGEAPSVPLIEVREG